MFLIRRHCDAKSIINQYAGALKKINASPDQALGILIVPDESTAYQEKEKALDALSKKYKSKKFNRPKLHAEIKKFINAYCSGWVLIIQKINLRLKNKKPIKNQEKDKNKE